MKDYVGIIVNNEAVKLDKIFTYKVPDNLKDDILVGHRVKVPFGFGNKFIDGFVINFYKEDDIDKENIKKLNM